MKRDRLLAGVVSALFSLCFLTPPASAASAYTVVEFGEVDEGGSLVIRALNRAGQVTGGSLASGRGHRAHVLTTSKREDINPLSGGDFSMSNGINDLGEVAGSSNTATGIRAFFWTGKGGIRALGALAGDSSSEAFAINAKGDMVGYSSGRAGMRAVRWTRSGAIQILDSLPGATLSRAVAINDRGDAVGTSWGVSGKRAVLWSGGASQDLGTLPRNSESEAVAVNNSGEVVGSSYEADGTRQAVLWAPGAAIRKLGLLTGGTSSRALAINDAGDIVGAASSLLGLRAVLWTRTGDVTDLNTTIPPGGGFVLMEAVAINQLGVIIALGQDDHGHGLDHEHRHPEAPTRVFLLIPVR
jgi:probable HAF family extracellular repeat protein